MKSCCSCAEPYVPQGSAWGDECGVCIAAQIEMMLTGAVPARDRVPMKRAADLAEDFERREVDVPLRQRAAGN